MTTAIYQAPGKRPVRVTVTPHPLVDHLALITYRRADGTAVTHAATRAYLTATV